MVNNNLTEQNSENEYKRCMNRNQQDHLLRSGEEAGGIAQ